MPIKPIRLALEEARKSILQVVMFQTALDTLVVYVLLLLACLLLTLPSWYAVIPVIVYAIIHLHGNIKDVNFSNIEQKFPELKEQLITVADNWKDQNEIIDALNLEVLQKMKEIRTSAFLNLPKVTREITVMAVVSFLIIGASAFNVKFLDFAGTINEIRNFTPFQQYDPNAALLKIQESQNLTKILGNKSAGQLGKQSIDIQINPILDKVNIGKVLPPQPKEFANNVAPPEIKASTDTSFEEQIPAQYQRMVKTYFTSITK